MNPQERRGKIGIVCPIYFDRADRVSYLRETVDALLAQTDSDWHLFVVDDQSPLPNAADIIRDTLRPLWERCTLQLSPRNTGPGGARNLAIQSAAAQSVEFLLLQDGDDIPDPRRVESSRAHFTGREPADFLYSAFSAIDERSAPVPPSDLESSIREFCDLNARGNISTAHRWFHVTPLTSTVGMRTTLAVDTPFPISSVSEDMHTFMRAMAKTDAIVFDDSTVARYRVTTDGSGSNSRRQQGPGFFAQKAWIDTLGFHAAANIALGRHRLSIGELAGFIEQHFIGLSRTLEDQGNEELAARMRSLARPGDPAQWASATPTRDSILGASTAC